MAQNGSRMTLFKMDWEPIDNILGPIWDHFEAFLTLLDPTKGQIHKGNGPFGGQKMAQNGSKMTLFKMNWEPIDNILGQPWNPFEAFLTIFGRANC